jgi:hypothetical protein
MSWVDLRPQRLRNAAGDVVVRLGVRRSTAGWASGRRMDRTAVPGGRQSCRAIPTVRGRSGRCGGSGQCDYRFRGQAAYQVGRIVDVVDETNRFTAPYRDRVQVTVVHGLAVGAQRLPVVSELVFPATPAIDVCDRSLGFRTVSRNGWREGAIAVPGIAACPLWIPAWPARVGVGVAGRGLSTSQGAGVGLPVGCPTGAPSGVRSSATTAQ